MPANLPPDYFEADKRFREAKTHREKIACLEEMLTIMPKHKGTDKLRADLNSPFVLKKGSTVENFAGMVHKDFTNRIVE